jgi:L-amino acid N-acyltransferase
MVLTDATEGDLAGILSIYNDVILTSTAVYSDQPVTLEDRRTWWQTRVNQGFPVIVAADDSGVCGFGSFGDFRAWPGYRFTVEHSVHVRTDCRRSGIGTALVEELIRRAAAAGKHVMIAGIDAQNESSLRLHARVGFASVGIFREVGFKFGRWLDLHFMQRHLPDVGLLTSKTGNG